MPLHTASLRVAIIGPIYPYKGGIAHYTGLLAKEIAKAHPTKVVSFSLQYPSFFYPGQQQKDYDNDSFRFEGTEYLINTINPFSWISTSVAIARFTPDLLIIPWWNPFFGPAFAVIAMLVKLLGRAKVLFLIHNVFPHERLPLDRLVTTFSLNRGDFFIVQSGENEAKLLDIVHDPVYRKTMHPTYDAFNIDGVDRGASRKALGLPADAEVMLFFGFVREYKGLMYLIEALPAIGKRLENACLLVVGDFYDDKPKYLERIEELGVSAMVKIFDGYIPDREVGRYFTSADLVVLPYVAATQSGIVQIAYGFGKPVVVTSVGGLPEVVEDGRTGYVVPPRDAGALADAVVLFFEQGRGEELSAAIAREQERFSWRRLVETIEELMKVPR